MSKWEPIGREPDASMTASDNVASRTSLQTCPPNGKPPDYTRMSDKEISSTVEKEHVFTPL